MKISKEEHDLICTILHDWFEIFGEKTKGGHWKREAYSEELEFCESFMLKSFERDN